MTKTVANKHRRRENTYLGTAKVSHTWGSQGLGLRWVLLYDPADGSALLRLIEGDGRKPSFIEHQRHEFFAPSEQDALQLWTQYAS